MELIDWFLLLTWFSILVGIFMWLYITIEKIRQSNQRRKPKPCKCQTPKDCDFYDRCMK